jgi:hypothetical protein
MSERRAASRYALSVPVTLRTAFGTSETGKTLELSTSGLSFTSDAAPVPGETLDFTVKIPFEMTGGTNAFIHGSCTVLRADKDAKAKFKIAATIERYEMSREDLIEELQSLGEESALESAWFLSGTYIESCNCSVGCPCVFLSPPTNDECTLLIGWHIEKGCFGDTALDGLNVAIAAYSRGHMLQTRWKAAIYIDGRANAAQEKALRTIFLGEAGGHPVNLAAQIGEVLGIKNVPIEYHSERRRRRLRIADIAEAEIEGIIGQNGSSVTIANHPLCIAPGYPTVLAKSKQLSYSDHGFEWNVTEKNGFFSPFSYAN